MCSLSKSFRLSSTLRIEEEAAMVFTKNQGIGSILESSNKSSSSLRRTLSADMSSTKWLTQHGFCPMKKIASSEEFSICSVTDSSSSEDEDVETEPRSQFDIWSSIIQQKSQEITDNKSLPPPPYIHPLVKRSASCLNQKSLQICTESLGSETGSDGLFSSYPSSVSGDVTDDDDDKETEQDRALEQSFEEGFVPKYNYVAKKSPQRQRSFPPPMPSRRMQWRRDYGRLVLEAVSVPCTNNFLAQRRDGRLVLTFANGIEQEEEEEEEEEKEVEKLESEEVLENFNDGDKESDEEEVEAAFVMELEAPRVSSTSRVINVHRLTPMGLANRDPITTWPNKFNEVVKFDEDEEDIKPAIVAKSLPPMALLIPKPPVGMGTAAAAGGRGGASFNAYEYYWRPNPMTITQSKNNKKNTQEEKQQLLLLRGNKGENLVPLVKSCKEPRKSLLFWEPYCIATS